MIILAWIVWNVMWGVAGYFTVRAIQNRIAWRKMTKEIRRIQELLAETDRALGGES